MLIIYKNMLSRRKYTETIFIIWGCLALVSLPLVTILLKGPFPIFTVLWITVPLVTVIRTKNAKLVGIRLIPWSEFLRISALNLTGVFLVMLLFEPWSHTYQKLLDVVLSNQTPDTTFAWLVRYPRLPALGGMLLFSGLVTLFGEELFFRGWLLQVLRKRMQMHWAVAIQAFLFVIPNLLASFFLPLMQGVLYACVYTWLAIGMIGGWAASRTNSIWPSLFSATLANFVLVILLVGKTS